jgi:hypothetical protein
MAHNRRDPEAFTTALAVAAVEILDFVIGEVKFDQFINFPQGMVRPNAFLDVDAGMEQAALRWLLHSPHGYWLLMS